MPAGLSLPHAENAAQSVLSLPMFPDMTEGQVDTVCRAVAAYFAGRREVATMPILSPMAA